MEGLDYLGTDGTLRTLPRIIPNARVAAPAGDNETATATSNPRRATTIRRVKNGALGLVIGAAYGSIVAGPLSLPLCALAGAAIGGAFPLNDESSAPIPVTRLPYRQPWRERENQPAVAIVKREPEEMPAAAPASTDNDRFGRLEID